MPTTNLGLATINQSDNISPTPINQNMEKLDALGLDYVVAQGTSGNWRYRRWKSGTYECWGRYAKQSAAPTIMGYDNQGYAQVTMQYPVTFVEAPVVTATARADDNPKCFVAYMEHHTGDAQFWVGGLNWGETADLECNVYAIGRLS